MTKMGRKGLFADPSIMINRIIIFFNNIFGQRWGRVIDGK